jgi:uncharacterized protein
MKWTNRRRSANVEDRRGKGSSMALKGGGLVVIAAVVMLLLGKDPSALLQILGGSGEGEPHVSTAYEDSLAEMSSVVLASTEDIWTTLFQQQGATYQAPKLVLFTGSVQSACGFAQSAMGPFYCSGDSKVYLDLSFFDELGSKFGASGDFAQAYVIAHEVGHHIQHLLGDLDEVQQKRQTLGEVEANRLTVRLELQADFYAGIWAHYADRAAQLLEKGDLEEALNAASQIGDDILQKRSQGKVVPDSFTHGSSEQRLRWFKAGYESGDWTRAGELFELAYNRL